VLPLQNPPELAELPPSAVAFWIAAEIGSAPDIQQRVLTTRSAEQRLDYVIATLDAALKHLAAARAVQSTFTLLPSACMSA
jgi:hypothetical protein